MTGNLLRKLRGEPLRDAAPGEGVGDAEVEILLEVREGIRMDDEAVCGMGRKDADEVGVVTDEVHKGGNAVREKDGEGVDVLFHQRAVRGPDGVSRLLGEILPGGDERG